MTFLMSKMKTGQIVLKKNLITLEINTKMDKGKIMNMAKKRIAELEIWMTLNCPIILIDELFRNIIIIIIAIVIYQYIDMY